jgi:hypothetical protein
VTEQPDNQPEDQTSDVAGDSSDDGVSSKDVVSNETTKSGMNLTDSTQNQQGPGWLPALMAMSLLAGIAFFICCGVTTWLLYQKRTELAVRTLEGAYITELEQSYLDPSTKRAVVDEVKELIAEMEAGDFENWQSAAIMQRLQRLPVVQWGDLQAIELFITKENGAEKDEQLKEISRLGQAVVDGSVTSFDFQDVLESVHRADPKSSSGFSLILPLTAESVAEVCLRAKLVADRAKVANRRFPEVDLAAIVRREISLGSTAGGF